MKTKLTIAALVAMGVAAQAAVITWDAGAGSTSPLDVATEILNEGTATGSLGIDISTWDNSGITSYTASQGALNFHGSAVSVNGVSFDGPGGVGDYWSGTATDAGVDSIISDGYATFEPGTLTISGLLANQEYKIQLIGLHDDRTGGISDRTQTYQDQDGGLASTTLTRGTGGYVIGTFTTGAAETSTSISVIGATDPGVAGVVVRAIPEPATLGLVTIFGGAVLFLRRLRIIG